MSNKKTNGKCEHSSGKNKFALLLIDIISNFEFEDGERLFKCALPAARKIAELKRKAQKFLNV
ncbi:MAG: hypothetical protein ACR2GD_00075 [Pyrinomonadaceae bacterium]